MGSLHLVYCDNCERHTPLLPTTSWPDGWCSIAFPDKGSYAMCSYQCLLEFCRRMVASAPVTSLTPTQPQENPCPRLEHLNFDRVPQHLRYDPERPNSKDDVVHDLLHHHSVKE